MHNYTQCQYCSCVIKQVGDIFCMRWIERRRCFVAAVVVVEGVVVTAGVCTFSALTQEVHPGHLEKASDHTMGCPHCGQPQQTP